MPPLKEPAPGVIDPGALYTIAEVRSRLGIGAAPMKKAKACGLNVRRVGRRHVVVGADLIEFIRDGGLERGNA